MMFATRLTTARDTVLSLAGTLVFSTLLIGAAVIPAQTAAAAVLGL